MSIEMKLQMQAEYNRATQNNQQSQIQGMFGNMFGRQNNPPARQESPFLGISVRRSHILADSISVAERILTNTHAGSKDLKKPLKIKFKGEAGVDAGGVTKEL